MKQKTLILILAVVAMTWFNSKAAAQVGYINLTFGTGDSLFVNQLSATNNHLSGLFSAPPEGTEISLWNPASQSYTNTATYAGGVWSQDLSLPPGLAARLHNPSAPFLNTFVGYVVNPDGTTPADVDHFENHLPTPPADGLYLLGCATPMAFGGGDAYDRAFRFIVGRAPRGGEQFLRWDQAAKQFSVSTFDASTLAWDGMVSPTLAVGEAGFFNLGPVTVPEPGCFGLLTLGWMGSLYRPRR